VLFGILAQELTGQFPLLTLPEGSNGRRFSERVREELNKMIDREAIGDDRESYQQAFNRELPRLLALLVQPAAELKKLVTDRFQ
jgi:hypothetical protein